MELLKRYRYIIISACILIILAILGFSYAYYTANVTVVSETQTIIKSKKLALTFNDTKEINSTDMMPGKVVEKTFNVVSTADDDVTYNIKFNEITNTYNEDVVFTLIKDGVEVVSQTPLPDTTEKDYIYTNVSIVPNATHDYVLKITYLNTDKQQILSRDDIFAGTVEIDVEDITKELVYVPYTTNEITSTDTETPDDLEENEKSNRIINEFTVKNTSAVQTQNYNVLLEDIENEYNEGELTYSLEKNGEEISSGNVPQDGEIPYLTTNEELLTGGSDKYSLILTENVDNTVAYAKQRYTFSLLSNEIAQAKALSKKFSAKVVINQGSADMTAPESIFEYQNKTTNSVTYKASCIDSESGIRSYKFYKNGSLVETKETDEKSMTYVFKNLNAKEYEFKLVCTNKVGVTTTLSQTVAPTGLIGPTYNVATGPAQSKNVEIAYTGEGTYLFKATGEVTSNIDVIDCGETSEGATYSCSENVVTKNNVLTSGKWYKVEGNLTLTYTSNGSIVAKVADGTNYVTGEEIQVDGIDREAPSTPEIESEYTSGSWTNKEVVLKLSSTDNVAVDYYEYKVGETEWLKVSGNEIKLTEDMEKVVGVRAIDTAENISEVKEVEVKIDTKKPTVEFEITENTTYAKSQSTKVSASDNVEVTELKYAWSTSDKEPTFENTFTNGDILTIDSVTGKYYLWVSVKDSAGNVTITKTGLFYVDNTNPTCSISGNPTAWVTSATLSVTGTDTEKINTKPYSWDGTTYSTTQTKGITANGTYTAYVKDEAGNVKTCSVTVSKVDPTAPSAPTLGTVSNYGKSLTVAFTAGTDADSGVTHTCYYAEGTTADPNVAGALSGTTCSFNNLKQGTTYRYKVCAKNGAGTQTCSSVGNTTTYTGVAAGTYTVGSTVSYGGLSWYVLGDTGTTKGSYLKLVQNGVTGNGTYNNANSYLNSTFLTNYSAINTDKSRGGLVAQGSNYVTTDSGTTAYRPNYVYWNKSGYVVIPNAVSKYALSSYTYKSSGFGYNVKLINDSGGHHYYYGGVTTSTLYTAGQNVALANTSSSITYTNGGFNTTTGSLSSARSMELIPSNSVKTPSANTLPMTYEVYSLEATGINTNKATLTNSYENQNTKTWVFYPCGPTKYAVTLTAVSSTKYNYDNKNTGGNSDKKYSDKILYSFAGNVSSSTEGSSPSYKRTYDFWGNGNNCTAYTAYSLKNTSANVYYRPYILVREAYAS